MTRILRTRLGDIAEEEVKKLGIAAVACNIGIAENTLRKLLRDEWDYINRDNVELLCDHFGVDLDRLFYFEKDNFWLPFEQSSLCTFVRGSAHDTLRKRGCMEIPAWDIEATSLVQKYLRKTAPCIRVEMADFLTDQEAIKLQAVGHSCIVIGSQRSNPATEVLIAHLFGAVPFDSSAQNRKRIPFYFVWPQERMPNQGSAFAEKATKTTGDKLTYGISLKNGRFLSIADYLPNEVFEESDIADGRDCALLLIANNPFGTNSTKLVVLAGFSGVGTVAAAEALISDFRNLEPRGEEKIAWGVIRASYRKSSRHADDRQPIGYRWVYRKGGRPLLHRKAAE